MREKMGYFKKSPSIRYFSNLLNSFPKAISVHRYA